MQTSKKERCSTIRRPDVRSLKIQPRCREGVFNSKDVPEIRLCGEWLNKLGFAHGRRVVVTTMNELLIIRLQNEN
jgi:hypothetical protein